MGLNLKETLSLVYNKNLYVYKNLEFQAGEGSCLKEHLMFKWYMNKNFSLKVLKIVVVMYRFILYAYPIHCIWQYYGFLEATSHSAIFVRTSKEDKNSISQSIGQSHYLGFS